MGLTPNEPPLLIVNRRRDALLEAPLAHPDNAACSLQRCHPVTDPDLSQGAQGPVAHADLGRFLAADLASLVVVDAVRMLKVPEGDLAPVPRPAVLVHADDATAPGLGVDFGRFVPEATGVGDLGVASAEDDAIESGLLDVLERVI